MNLQHQNVYIQIEFLPPNMTSVQPLDQGISAKLKAYYVQRTFTGVLSKLDANPWKNFTILKIQLKTLKCMLETRLTGISR